MHFLRVVRCSLVKHCLAALRRLKNFVANYCSSYHPFLIQDHIIRTNPVMSENNDAFDLTKVKNGQVLPYCKTGALLFVFGSRWREFLREARCNIRSRQVYPGSNAGHVLYPLEIESKGEKDLEFPVSGWLHNHLAQFRGGNAGTLRFIRPQVGHYDCDCDWYSTTSSALGDTQGHFEWALTLFDEPIGDPSLARERPDNQNVVVNLYSNTSDKPFVYTLGSPIEVEIIDWFHGLVQASFTVEGGPPAMVVMESADDRKDLKLFADETIASAKTRPASPGAPGAPGAPRAEKSDPPIDTDPPKEPSPKDTAPNTQLLHATAPGAVEAKKARTEEKQQVVIETIEENTTSVEPENPQQPPNSERRSSELLTQQQELDLRSKQLEDRQKRLERREQEVEQREQEVEQREQAVEQREQAVEQREQEASAVEMELTIRYERLGKVEGEVRETVQVVAEDKEDIRRKKNKNQRMMKRLDDAAKQGYLQKDSQQVSSEASDNAAETRDIYGKNIEEGREAYNEVLTMERERHRLDSEDKDRTILAQAEQIAEQGADLRIQEEEITNLSNERDALRDELNERQPQSEQTRPESKRTQPGRKSKVKPKFKAEAGGEGPDKYFYCDRCMRYLRTEEVSLTTLSPSPSTISPTSTPPPLSSQPKH